MATLEQIQAKMNKLKAQAEALAAKNAQAVVDKIRKLMLQHGLTTKDIEASAKTKRAATKVSKSTGGKVEAKYQDPKSGATWSGRGRAPAWIAGAKDRNRFLIGTGADAAVAPKRASAAKVNSKVNAAAKGLAKAAPATQYRDPKSGATWSGRGRAPLWIAGAKDRSKFLIDGVQAAASVSKTDKPKAIVEKAPAASKTSAAKKAVVTKSPVVSEKTAAKKSIASSAKPKVVKKVAARKTAAVETAAANSNEPVASAPAASGELSA